ncbi:MAG: biopolymer transporter ExbD [Paucimonas sp.]|jgi:biopolymer transport protein ExbD|nr:biopolymer transporter ExbD [Paucimonas sp.]
MAFGGFNDNKQPAPMSEINVTPMVDVMLVLLVIFIITAPLFSQSIKLDLPDARSTPASGNAETISLSITADGNIFWDTTPLEKKELDARLSEAAKKNPQPELQLRADRSTRYEVIADIMAAAQNSGMTKIGFVTEPKPADSAN